MNNLYYCPSFTGGYLNFFIRRLDRGIFTLDHSLDSKYEKPKLLKYARSQGLSDIYGYFDVIYCHSNTKSRKIIEEWLYAHGFKLSTKMYKTLKETEGVYTGELLYKLDE